jgi:hypothetical protein
MREDIAVGMTDGTFFERQLNAADDEFAPLRQAM